MNDQPQKKRSSLPGFIAKLWEEFKQNNPGVKPTDISQEMGISKQNHWKQTQAENEVLPIHWKRWRKALRLSKIDFWKKAQQFYDP